MFLRKYKTNRKRKGEVLGVEEAIIRHRIVSLH